MSTRDATDERDDLIRHFVQVMIWLLEGGGWQSIEDTLTGEARGVIDRLRATGRGDSYRLVELEEALEGHYKTEES